MSLQHMVVEVVADRFQLVQLFRVVRADPASWAGRIAERIRDKVAASRARGMWMGGYVPLGYLVKDRKLIINEAEAATVP